MPTRGEKVERAARAMCEADGRGDIDKGQIPDFLGDPEAAKPDAPFSA